VPTPEGGLKTLSVKSWFAGVLPPMTLTSTTTATTMISATVSPSIESRTRVATRAGREPSKKTGIATIAPNRNIDHSGGLTQMPVSFRNVAMKCPHAQSVPRP
jgi:hypothetical protein